MMNSENELKVENNFLGGGLCDPDTDADCGPTTGD